MNSLDQLWGGPFTNITGISEVEVELRKCKSTLRKFFSQIITNVYINKSWKLPQKNLHLCGLVESPATADTENT